MGLWDRWWYVTNYSILLYYYTKKSFADLAQPTISSVLGKDATAFNGVPLFTASNDGELKLKIKLSGVKNFSGDDVASTIKSVDIAIQDGPFANIAHKKGLFTSYETDYTINGADGWVWKNDGTEYTVEFKVKKGKTYWIKCYPEDDKLGISVETTKIQVTSES